MEKVYRLQCTAPLVLVVILVLATLGVGATLSALLYGIEKPGSRGYDSLVSVARVCVAATLFLGAAAFFFRQFPALWPNVLREVRIRERILTLCYARRKEEIWLGDVVSVGWYQGTDEGTVILHAPGRTFAVPLALLERADAVEIIEWLRWGTPRDAQRNWDWFCLHIAIPRRGPATRALYEPEARYGQHWVDLPCAVAIGIVAVLGAVVWFWTGRWTGFSLAPLILAAWTIRFTIPRYGIAYSPAAPRRNVFWISAGASLLIAATLAWAAQYFGVGGIALLAVAPLLATIVTLNSWSKKNKAYIEENQSRWEQNAMANWAREARTGAWSLDRGTSVR